MQGELAAILRAPVPPVFEPRVPLPLRVGIFADLMTASTGNADQLALRKWLVRWCSTDQYRRALADGGMRFDLAGNAVEPISTEASAHAAELLAKEAARCPPYETYLGDGVYASCDGFQIRLRTEQPDGQHVISIEPDVLGALVLYAKRCRLECPK